ncbi:hypothetical protein [Clostridium sp.]|uniref:hypothetical protein n=1 Tax=Clostridium sp. TaxID=1506 RepID=UPI00262F8464|nr:hypothetical protein [Clostridium sp.]
MEKHKSHSSKDEINIFEVRNGLLLEAMDSLGVCTPIQAASIWAYGVKNRNAAFQYSVMSDKLKEIYKCEMEKNAPNWVTGVSSPWIDSYSILRIESTSFNTYIVEIIFYFSTSTGHYKSSKAFLLLCNEDNCYKINKISMENFLYPYTGFALKK